MQEAIAEDVQEGGNLAWSERFPVEDSGDAVCAMTAIMPVCNEHILLEGTDDRLQFRRCNGLEEQWGTPWIDTDWRFGYGQFREQFLQVLARDEEGNVRLLELDAGQGYTKRGEGVLVVSGADAVTPALARSEELMRLFAAVQVDETVSVYTSEDAGQTWAAKHSEIALTYPALWCDGQVLWLAGYIAEEYQGAQGRVLVWRYDALAEGLDALGEEAIVGPSDKGRPGIIVHPALWEAIVLAPKTTEWEAEGPLVAIAEYVSKDSGQSWTRRGFQAVT
ncbi:MAG: hypothetical protein PHZ19_11145 [Candidatus Thermoplasmatota archaeon]|nr:hypothetical protein [Candidatus Thermoplasmatota archaeon]